MAKSSIYLLFIFRYASAVELFFWITAIILILENLVVKTKKIIDIFKICLYLYYDCDNNGDQLCSWIGY